MIICVSILSRGGRYIAVMKSLDIPSSLSLGCEREDIPGACPTFGFSCRELHVVVLFCFGCCLWVIFDEKSRFTEPKNQDRWC